MSNPNTKGGNFVPALCNIAGTLILLSVIAFCLMTTLPHALGYEVYHVVSGSMEPEIPVGSVIYVEKAKPEEITKGDIIAFFSGESVITHRVVLNQIVEGKFTTKGDANAKEDMNDVGYDALIGKVSAHYPMIGGLMEVYSSSIGKAYVICFAACGAMLNILAGRIRERNRSRREEAENRVGDERP